MTRKNYLLLVMLLLMTAWQSATAQQRRPIDSQHPLWLIHIDVWNSADPQKIINLIPDDIKPYVCMNLSLSCQFDTKTSMYRMPRNAVRTYKSWATVCQQNGMWFSCQPASGGHTHIQDNDLETFEYFFKTYPNFLGWNYAEQFWAFGDAGDLSSMTAASRWALFANLVEMSHKYGGFLTVSWCGGVYHMNTNPIAELKSNKDFLSACQKYPEAIVFLYKYTHCSSFYNNESVCWGPFISGLTKNYGVRYDNCGWNDMLSKLLGENHGKKYPGSAGIGTVMEQTCVNGGAVWDGPELIWREECFLNQSDSNVDGYTRRNWAASPHFKGIWLEMWRRIIDGTMYIPSREEVVAKTKIVVVNDKADDYTSWDDLYNGLYLQTDPGNQRKEGQWNYGQWQNNLCYFKSTGRYGAIPIVTGLYDDAAKAIPLQVKKSNYTSRWSTQAKKQADFNAQYPEVSKGDLYVNRYRNQLVTYTPYTYLNTKKSASAEIPLLYNTCDSLKLQYGKLSAGVIREYADHIDFYFNNYRSDSLTQQTDKIVITGVTSEPTCKLTKPTIANLSGHNATMTGKSYDAEKKTFSVNVQHMGAAILRIDCSGAATDRQTDFLPATALEQPKQPEPYKGPIIIEAEDMDRKSVTHRLTNSGWWAQDYFDFAGLGFIETQASTNSALRHTLKLAEAGEYNILVRYCNSSKAGNIKATVNGTAQEMAIEKVAINDWREAVVTATLKAGSNTLVLQNSGAIKMTIDQVIYEPVGTPKEKFNVKVREADFGNVVADVDSAAAGQTVHLTIIPSEGYGIKALNIVNSIFFTQGKTIPVSKDATEVTFQMPDDNVTIQPVFYDKAAVYILDFTDVVAGALPIGWRTTDGTDVRNYPTSNGSGPRTFTGLTGYQGKALYWRTTSAEYGRQSNYPLSLQAGKYQLVYAMAAWKGTPTYQVKILNSSGTAIKSTSTITAMPNLNGNGAGDISSAERKTLDFDVTAAGKYIIQFKEVGSGMQEFLLAECRLRDLNTTGIATVNAASRWPRGIYGPTGVHRQTLQPGLNIVVDADGNVKKVLVR
ncbi:MAG: glycosyl hydrolase family 98 [Prevotella sp.]|nr:glycosyl hydrolase family 98 [Prevotella sp.]